jgi:tellurite methyltransferase
MDLHGWEQRYRSAPTEEEIPTPLLIEMTCHLQPGTALDLACGAGRNALWLAERGWVVTAVDGTGMAIEVLRSRAAQRRLPVTAQLADLEAHQYAITPCSWDLIIICYYLQRDLIEPAKLGVVPGGLLIIIVHLAETGEPPTKHRLGPRELKDYFRGWEILHSYEGWPSDPAHRRSVAEVVARKPLS